MSQAVLLSQIHRVYALDTDPKKMDVLNQRSSPVKEAEISDYL